MQIVASPATAPNVSDRPEAFATLHLCSPNPLSLVEGARRCFLNLAQFISRHDVREVRDLNLHGWVPRGSLQPGRLHLPLILELITAAKNLRNLRWIGQTILLFQGKAHCPRTLRTVFAHPPAPKNRGGGNKLFPLDRDEPRQGGWNNHSFQVCEVLCLAANGDTALIGSQASNACFVRLQRQHV